MHSFKIFIKQCELVDKALHNATNIEEMKKELSNFCITLNNIDNTTKEKNYTCNICSYSFETEPLLKKHARQHNLRRKPKDATVEKLKVSEKPDNIDCLKPKETGDLSVVTVEPTLEEIFLNVEESNDDSENYDDENDNYNDDQFDEASNDEINEVIEDIGCKEIKTEFIKEEEEEIEILNTYTLNTDREYKFNLKNIIFVYLLKQLKKEKNYSADLHLDDM